MEFQPEISDVAVAALMVASEAFRESQLTGLCIVVIVEMVTSRFICFE
jgi:hypothetical protein